jgi:hypothetical protein
MCSTVPKSEANIHGLQLPSEEGTIIINPAYGQEHWAQEMQQLAETTKLGAILSMVTSHMCSAHIVLGPQGWE